MNIVHQSKPLALFVIVSGSMLGQAADPSSVLSSRCADLLKMRIENTALSVATELPAGAPVQVGGGYGPPITVKSLPAHCWVQGEVNHHRGAGAKDYGDRFEIRMPEDWSGRLLFQGGGGLDGLLNPALGLENNYPSPASKSALARG